MYIKMGHVRSKETLDINVIYVQGKLSLPCNSLLLYCDHQDSTRTSFLTSVKLAIFRVLTEA
jgi:hypothetical protein